MNRSNMLEQQGVRKLTRYRQKVAFHEAGHAVAIHIHNRQKNLPPVFFQIFFNGVRSEACSYLSNNNMALLGCSSGINGGLLVQSLLLPCAVADEQTPVQAPINTEDEAYLVAFETDIVNLLIGPLAEAKYSAQMDNEPFNAELVAVPALKYYGGEADLAVVDSYLQSYSANKHLQNASLSQLFSQAYHFVSDRENWQAITRLAQYILTSDNAVIGCDEVAAVLDGQ